MKTYPCYRASTQGWFRPPPEHWNDAPIWTLFTRTSLKGNSEETLLSVYRDHGVVPKDSRQDNNNKPSDDLSSYQLVRPRDLVVNKMKAWQGSLSISTERGIVSPAYFVYRPHHQAVDRFLHYLLRSRPLIGAYISISKGIRPSQWDLNPQNFSRLKLSLPPFPEQRVIADFLDRETARIDTLIEEQQRLIELLRERRASAISSAFISRGALRLRYAITLSQTGPFGTQLSSSEYVRDGVPIVNPSHIVDCQIVPDPEASVTEAKASELGRYQLRRGDIIVGRKGEVDKSALVGGREVGYVCGSDSMVLRPARHTHPPYLWWFFQSPECLGQLTRWSVGSTVTGLNQAAIAKIVLPFPPIEDQRAVADQLEHETARIDRVISETETFIDLARERRSALITAAVTGQINVRDEVA